MKNPKAYPLAWPANWPRVRERWPSAFKTNAPDGFQFEDALLELEAELRRLNATDAIISSNKRGWGQPRDVGVAVYFKLNGKKVALACDKWTRVECNVWAIAKHIAALRGQDRWGIGTVEQAFTGYLQLPAPMVLKPWYVILEVEEYCPYAEAQASYRRLAKIRHPDNGGSVEAMSELNGAWEEAKAALLEAA